MSEAVITWVIIGSLIGGSPVVIASETCFFRVFLLFGAEKKRGREDLGKVRGGRRRVRGSFGLVELAPGARVRGGGGDPLQRTKRSKSAQNVFLSVLPIWKRFGPFLVCVNQKGFASIIDLTGPVD